jgi:hypothetical protein
MLSGMPEERWPDVRHGIAALRHRARYGADREN